VQHQTGSFTTSDNLRLFTQQWVPDNPKAALIVSHGYAEHSQRYAHFAQFMVENGVAVYALDHRGHGRSDGERANVKSFAQFVRSLEQFIEIVKEQTPSLPHFLLGHSMGGAVATQLVLENPQGLDGLILSSPFLKNANKVSPLLLSLSGVISRYLPGLPTVKLDAGLVSRDKDIVSAYVNDPLVYTGGTKARLGSEMLKAGEAVLEQAQTLKLPLLVLAGTGDGLADPSGGEALFNAASSDDKNLKTYEGFYHELLNEPEKEDVYKDVLEWLKARLG